MPVLKSDSLAIRTENDIVVVRQAVRKWASELGFGLVDSTKLVTAASELARNALVHGGGGTVLLEIVAEGMHQGLRLTFEDHGPGIPDLERALQDGFSTAGGLGLGLSGSKRLVPDFTITSRVGEGTRVTITKWK